VKLARLTTLLSGILTVLCAVGIFGFELSSWVENGVWRSYTLSSVQELFKNQDVTYVTASTNGSEPDQTIWQAVGGWLLSTPLTGLLIVVTALHFVCYLYIPSGERTLSTD